MTRHRKPWRIHFVVVAALAGAVVGCTGRGDTPTGPSSAPQALLSAGPHSLELGSCFVAGTSLSVNVTVSREGTTWVIRSSGSTDGDVELRLTEGMWGLGAYAASGTGRGTAVGTSSTTAERVTIALGAGQSAANVAGTISTFEVAGLPLAFGLASGNFTVSTARMSETCTITNWGIRRRG